MPNGTEKIVKCAVVCWCCTLWLMWRNGMKKWRSFNKIKLHDLLEEIPLVSICGEQAIVRTSKFMFVLTSRGPHHSAAPSCTALHWVLTQSTGGIQFDYFACFKC